MPFVNCPKALWDGVFIAFIGDRPCIREDKLFYNATVIGIPVVI